jgi:hypothetical protein
MPIEITPIYLVLAALIGLLIGLLVSSLFTQKDVKHVNKTEPPAEMARDRYAEGARIWYSPGVKKVITELDGAYYRDHSTLSAEQKSRVNKLLELWSEWAGKFQVTKQDASVAEDPALVNEIAATEGKHLPPIGPVLDWSVEEALKTEETLEDMTERMAVKPRTVAQQISLVLEKMLEGNPLKEKGIKLIENDHHGVDVWIGLEKFDGIDDIPYPEVQDLIRQAVVRWERETAESRNQH